VASKHQPAPPREAEPPAALKELSERLSNSKVARAGLTTTSEGDWALLVYVYDPNDAPIAEIEAEARGAPVIYLTAGKTPSARPAFPRRGE
jgi:hypothetical protein